MNSKEIRSRISGLLVEQQKIALAGFTSESRAKFDRIQKDVEQHEADAQRIEAFETRDAEQRSFERSPRPGIGAQGEERRDRINKAFRSYARTGKIAEEHRDLFTSSDTTGGALIPQEFYPELVNALKFYGPIATKVKQKVTDGTGRPMKVALVNDTANGLTLLGTEGTSPAETDPSMLSKILSVDSVTGGLVKISFEELADSNFNLDTAIRDYFGVRYARGMEHAVTLGVDSAATTLPNQSEGGLLGQAAIGTTTGTIAAGIGWDDLVNLYGSLDPAYSGPTAAFVFNSATRAFLLGQKDGFGRPYWTPDPSLDSPFGKLLGFDVVINQAMPGPTSGAFSANSTPILFGDLQRAYVLRTDGAPSVLRLEERFADTLEVGFFMWSRIGGLYLGQSGVNPAVKLAIAAS
ncbi:MAG TPA: phage major capsid protein [Acidobacteriaceae bacterium]